MLKVTHLSKAYGIESLLEDVSFTLSPGERLGLIGPNGCGKTTLLRIIAGREAPDSGSVQLDPPNLQVGFLRQGQHPRPDDTISSFLAGSDGNPREIEVEISRLAAELARDPHPPSLEQDYDQALFQLERAFERETMAPEILIGLGLGHLSGEIPVSQLSGGQKTRLGLASILLARPKMLLLDEPTNHLDIEMLEWLEDWLGNALQASQTGMLIVSHDRAFLDRVATGILEIDPQTRRLRSFAGNYSAYLEQKIAEQEKSWQAFSDQQDEIARLQRSAKAIRSTAKFRKSGKGDSGDKFAKGFFGNRSAGTIRRAKLLEKRLEKLQTENRLEKPHQNWQMKLDFGQVRTGGRDVLRIDNLAVGYKGVPILNGITVDVRQGNRIALIGPNGAGKTTLLRTIAGRLPELGGSLYIGPSIQVGYMAQEQEELDSEQDVLTTILKQASFTETAGRTFLHQFLFHGDDVFTPVGLLSYGERARLSLACLVAQGCNLLLLDEPINHLDIPSRARFEQALETYQGTILAVVHDRFFIEGFASEIWEIKQGRLTHQVRDVDWID